MKESGFSVLELMVALGLFSIILGIVAHNSTTIRISINKNEAKNMVRRDLRLAQTMTVNEGGRGVVELAANGTSYEFGYDYLNYDTSDPIEYDSGSRQFTQYLPEGTKITISDTIIFDSKARVIDKDGIIIDVDIDFYDTSSGSDVLYEEACLSAIGVLTYGGNC